MSDCEIRLYRLKTFKTLLNPPYLYDVVLLLGVLPHPPDAVVGVYRHHFGLKARVGHMHGVILKQNTVWELINNPGLEIKTFECHQIKKDCFRWSARVV